MKDADNLVLDWSTKLSMWQDLRYEYPLLQRICPRKIALGKAFVHHHHLRAGAAVVVIDRPTSVQTNAKSIEITRSHDLEIGNRFVCVCRRLSCNRKRQRAMPS